MFTEAKKNFAATKEAALAEVKAEEARLAKEEDPQKRLLGEMLMGMMAPMFDQAFKQIGDMADKVIADPSEKTAELMKTLDTNKDDAVSKEEFVAKGHILFPKKLVRARALNDARASLLILKWHHVFVWETLRHVVH